MKRLAGDVSVLYRSCGEIVHPIDTTMALEGDVFAAAARIPWPSRCRGSRLLWWPVRSTPRSTMRSGKSTASIATEPMAPISWCTTWAIGSDREFDGLSLTQFVRTEPSPTMPVYHLVGALDPLVENDVLSRSATDCPRRSETGSARRTDASQDQAQRRRSRLGCQSRVLGVDHTAAQARPGDVRWHYSLDFNERCPECGVPAECLRIFNNAPAEGIRLHSVHRTTDGSRSESESEKRHARGGEYQARCHRRIACRSRELAARSRDGLYGRGSEGVQRPEPIAVDGGRRSEIRHVFVRAGPDVSWSILDSLRGIGGARSGSAGHRGERPTVLPCGERPLETTHPGIVRITNGTMMTGRLTGLGLGAC